MQKWASNLIILGLTAAGLAATEEVQSRFGAGEMVGVVESEMVQEASGLAASRKNAGVLWVHNDSGDAPRIYAMNTGGRHLGAYVLGGVYASDMEDMAIGPGPEPNVDYLYLGDIGDNKEERNTIAVYRVAEPAVDANQTPVTETLAGVETIRLRFPDKPHDAETLLVDPLTKDIYILTKQKKPRLYRAAWPQQTKGATTMEYLGKVEIQKPTGGDVSPDGSEILIRANFGIRLWKRDKGMTIYETLRRPYTEVPLYLELQGEAVCWDANGTGYFTVSEGGYQPIYYFGPAKAKAGDDNKGEKE
jgi:hypothetical protein